MQMSEEAYGQLPSLIEAMSWPAIALLTVVVIGIHYLVLNWIFAWSSRKFAEQVNQVKE